MKEKKDPWKCKYTFDEALKVLGIEEYRERIYHSNSRGELFHLYDYMQIAEALEEGGALEQFPSWFKKVVEAAEKEWNRPASVFQHIPKILSEHTVVKE